MKLKIYSMFIVVIGLLFIGCQNSIEDTPKSNTKVITEFNFVSPQVIGTVNELTHAISLTVPFGTDLVALSPTITHSGTGISPASGIAQDFTNPVTYTVAAEDGTTQDYTVSIIMGDLGVWLVDIKSPDGLTIWRTGFVMKITGSQVLEYTNTSDYSNNITTAESDIIFNSISDGYFLKKYTKTDPSSSFLLGLREKEEWIVTGDSIQIKAYKADENTNDTDPIGTQASLITGIRHN